MGGRRSAAGRLAGRPRAGIRSGAPDPGKGLPPARTVPAGCRYPAPARYQATSTARSSAVSQFTVAGGIAWLTPDCR